MKYTQLPSKLTIDNEELVLESNECSVGMFKGWWCFQYVKEKKDPNDKYNGFPVEVTDEKSIYFLCAMEPTKEKATEDMLERINSMTNLMTKELKEEQKKKWEELKNKRIINKK